MSRNDLYFSNKELIDYLYKSFKIQTLTLDYIEVGSFYGFIVETNTEKNTF